MQSKQIKINRNHVLNAADSDAKTEDKTDYLSILSGVKEVAAAAACATITYKLLSGNEESTKN